MSHRIGTYMLNIIVTAVLLGYAPQSAHGALVLLPWSATSNTYPNSTAALAKHMLALQVRYASQLMRTSLLLYSEL